MWASHHLQHKQPSHKRRRPEGLRATPSDSAQAGNSGFLGSVSAQLASGLTEHWIQTC